MRLYKARSDFSVREISGENVLIPIGSQVFRNNSVIVMNDTAMFMWENLKDEQSLLQIIKGITDEYEVCACAVLDDVDKFLTALLNVDALEVRNIDMPMCV